MKLFLDPAWQKQLKEIGLDSVKSILAFENDKCLSRHNRAATWKLTLPNGQTAFLKKDFYTSLAPILRQLIRLHLPETNTERERRFLTNAQRLGFHVPQIIAYTQHSWWCLPGKGAMIELAVQGKAVDDIVKDETVADEEKTALLKKAHALLGKIQDANLDWKKDCKPEHFFLCDDGEITLIDGERLGPARRKLTPEYREWQHQRFDSFLPEQWRNIR